jgi:hypothetical protein
MSVLMIDHRPSSVSGCFAYSLDRSGIRREAVLVVLLINHRTHIMHWSGWCGIADERGFEPRKKSAAASVRRHAHALQQ